MSPVTHAGPPARRGTPRGAILRVLAHAGPLGHRELMRRTGFGAGGGKDGAKFAYHMRKLLRQSLVAVDRPTREWSVSGTGRLLLAGGTADCPGVMVECYMSEAEVLAQADDPRYLVPASWSGGLAGG